MFVSTWNPVGNIRIPEINTIPVWLTLRNIPSQLYSTKGISWIGSGLGALVLTSKLSLDPTQMGEAKILVEVKLHKPFPSKVAIEDESGSITMVDVFYSWLPPKCVNCGQLGHKAIRCLGKFPPKQQEKTSTSSDIVSNSVLLAEINTHRPIMEATTGMNVVSASAATTSSYLPVYNEVSLASNETTNGLQVVSAVATKAVGSNPLYTEAVFTIPADTSSTEADSGSDKIETALPTTAISEAASKMTEIASPIDATFTTRELSPPASSNRFSTPQGVTSTLEVIPVVTNVEDGPSVCRILDNEAMFVNDGCNLQGESALQDEDLAITRTLRGRAVKPTQKLQEMEWTTVKGRGKNEENAVVETVVETLANLHLLHLLELHVLETFLSSSHMSKTQCMLNLFPYNSLKTV